MCSNENEENFLYGLSISLPKCHKNGNPRLFVSILRYKNEIEIYLDNEYLWKMIENSSCENTAFSSILIFFVTFLIFA